MPYTERYGKSTLPFDLQKQLVIMQPGEEFIITTQDVKEAKRWINKIRAFLRAEDKVKPNRLMYTYKSYRISQQQERILIQRKKIDTLIIGEIV